MKLSSRLLQAILPLSALVASGLVGIPRPSLAALNPAGPGVESSSLADIASAAGSSAGLAAFCNIDPAPIRSALRSFLRSEISDHARRHILWQNYRAAEADSEVALTRVGGVSCADAGAQVRDAVHDITLPPDPGGDEP